jgi:C4-dicarboxylate-specific signal transduction histidine kinase
MQRVRIALASILVLLLAGCGAPHELAKQADEVHSVAAEGALLAHEAAEGNTRATFAEEHAKALRKRLAKLRSAIEEPRLVTLAADVDRTLAQLARTPGDRARAAGAQRKLEHDAKAADELAQ